MVMDLCLFKMIFNFLLVVNHLKSSKVISMTSTSEDKDNCKSNVYEHPGVEKKASDDGEECPGCNKKFPREDMDLCEMNNILICTECFNNWPIHHEVGGGCMCNVNQTYTLLLYPRLSDLSDFSPK